MGICYGPQQQWRQIRRKNVYKRTKYRQSVIYEQKSVYESSFAASNYESRDDIKEIVQNYTSHCLNEEECSSLQAVLQAKTCSDPFILSNLEAKKCLHTHRVKLPECNKMQEISACPFDSNHMVEYDIWKLILAEEEEGEKINESEYFPEMYYVYHPFTQKFMSVRQGQVVASDYKMKWQVKPIGQRRHGGFIKISCTEGEVCMTHKKGLLQNHRTLVVCKQSHLSHFWEINCSELQ